MVLFVNAAMSTGSMVSIAWSIVGEDCTTERLVSPLLVLSLHTALVLDVVYHRPHLQWLDGPGEILEWSLVLATTVVYLRTSLSDPGFLRQVGHRSKMGILFFPMVALGAVAAVKQKVVGGPSRELQPIGRATSEDDVMSEDDVEAGNTNIHNGAGEGEAGGRCRHSRESSLGVPPSLAPSADDPNAVAEGRHPEQSGHRLRFCKICKMYQPLRCKHCRDCGKCVRTHDHHCPWIGTCVGEGNRVFFYWFLLCQASELLVFGVEGFLALLEEGSDLSTWVNGLPVLCAGLVVIFLLSIMVFCLLCFHSYLATANLTTWENVSWHNISYLKNIAPDDGSPFSRSLGYNLHVYCCRPWCPSRLRGHSQCKHDEDGWALWELSEPHTPKALSVCEPCWSCCEN